MVGDGTTIEQPVWVKNAANDQPPQLPHERPQNSPMDKPVDIHLNVTKAGVVHDSELDRPTGPMQTVIHPAPAVEDLPTMSMSLIELAREIRDIEQGPTLEMPAISVKPNVSAPATPDFGATQPSTPTPASAPQQPAPGTPHFTIKSK